ncbi:MAG: restriction endonuclease subunit S, partial [Flammeovirgaceae bacterium]
MQVKLSQILSSLESGGRPKGGASLENKGIPSLGVEHLDGNGGFNFKTVKYIPEEFFNSLKNGIIGKENILIVKDGATTGKVSFVTDEFPFDKAAVNEHVFLLKVNKSKANPKFVFHYLKCPQGQREIMRDFRGATVGGISRGFVDYVKLELPPLPDQLHIANLLSKAENLISQRKESIVLLEDFLKSVFSDLFGNPVTNKRNFKAVRLKELTTFLTSGGRGWGEYYSTHGERFIRSLDVRMNYISNEDAAFVNPPNNQEANRTKVQDLDILLTITGSKIGRVAMVPKHFGTAYVSQHVAIIRT